MFALMMNNVKTALTGIGVYSFPFSGENIFSECWTRENIKQDGTDKKYLLLFGCRRKQNISREVKLFGDKLRLSEKATCMTDVENWLTCMLVLLAGNGTSNLLITMQ